MRRITAPINEEVLLARCAEVEGLTFAALAARLGIDIPFMPSQRKGWLGSALEVVLGTTAGTAPKPDFHHLGIELKTLPMGAQGRPQESTFVTSINLRTIHEETWETSQCYSKLKRVLWIPVEGDKKIAFEHRRIGRGFLWSADATAIKILENDWHELSFMLGRGKLADVDASMGTYLQVRPKAANAQALCYGFDETGKKILTLPRGFYLRPSFTAKMMISR